MTLSTQTAFPSAVSEIQVGRTFAAVLRRVYLWMGLGLYLTAAVAYLVAHTDLIFLIVGNRLLFFGLLIGELVLVIALTAALNRLSPTAAIGLFLFYAALNGATMSIIFLAYTLTDITLAFVTTASLFAAMSFLGYVARLDLSRLGSFLLMGLIGLVIASVVNLFLASDALMWITTYAGIGLFLGLTVYDTQRIKVMVTESMASGDEASLTRLGLLGALRLYLDFVNLFLLILRLLGRRRR